LDFTLNGCGGDATVAVTYSEALPSGTYYKEIGGTYATYPAIVSASTVTFSLTDNGAGDDNGTVGTIHDPSGLAVAAPSTPVPTLSDWTLALLSLLLGAAVVSRRPGRRQACL
jgi:hypothetical protein